MTNVVETKLGEIENLAARDATKDHGRVKVGAGAINFADPTPARAATKDAGRVHVGAGAINF